MHLTWAAYSYIPTCSLQWPNSKKLNNLTVRLEIYLSLHFYIFEI